MKPFAQRLPVADRTIPCTIPLITIGATLTLCGLLCAQTRVAAQPPVPVAPTVLANHPVTHLQPRNVQFASRLGWRSPQKASRNQSLGTVSSPNAVLHLLIRPQGNTTEYSFKLSSQHRSTCVTPSPSNASGAFPSGAMGQAALGDMADIRMVLPGTTLKAVQYRFPVRNGVASPDLSIVAGQLYSDPFHAQWGCQRWGEGLLTIKTAQYNPSGQLSRMEASLSQRCEQTQALPIPQPQDPKPRQPVEAIQQYSYNATWRFSL